MRALTTFTDGLQQARSLCQERLVAQALDRRAELYAYRGDYALALRDALESQRIYEHTEAVFWKREDAADGSRWIEPTEADHAERARWSS